MAIDLCNPEEQMELAKGWLAGELSAIEEGKRLLAGPAPAEVGRAQHMVAFNYPSVTKHHYVIGQIKWRLGLGDPAPDLRSCVLSFAAMLRDCRALKIEADTYWASLVGFVAVILTGAVPDWIAQQQGDLLEYAVRKGRLKRWEINLGYQTALVVALHTGELPACWSRFAEDAEGRRGLKLIRDNLLTYEQLFHAIKAESWDAVPDIVAKVDRNYRKRGSSEASYPDVFGDGPYNSRSIDHIAAALLRVARARGAPTNLSTPHQWRWGDVDISNIGP